MFFVLGSFNGSSTRDFAGLADGKSAAGGLVFFGPELKPQQYSNVRCVLVIMLAKQVHKIGMAFVSKSRCWLGWAQVDEKLRVRGTRVPLFAATLVSQFRAKIEASSQYCIFEI